MRTLNVELGSTCSVARILENLYRHYYHVPLIKRLHLAGANLHTGNFEAETPLHIAGNLDIVKALTERDANLHARRLDSDDVLRTATRQGYFEIASELVDHCASVVVVRTSLHNSPGSRLQRRQRSPAQHARLGRLRPTLRDL
jgi:hypothetical protein